MLLQYLYTVQHSGRMLITDSRHYMTGVYFTNINDAFNNKLAAFTSPKLLYHRVAILVYYYHNIQLAYSLT